MRLQAQPIHVVFALWLAGVTILLAHLTVKISEETKPAYTSVTRLQEEFSMAVDHQAKLKIINRVMDEMREERGLN